MAETHQLTQVALIPSPGMGHLIPMAELAKRLAHHHPNLSLTIILPMFSSHPAEAEKSTLSSLPPSIASIYLPPPDLADLPQPQNGIVRMETLISLTVKRSLPSIREVLSSIISSSGKPLAAVVADLFGTDVLEVAREFQAGFYIFFPPPAMCLSLSMYLPELDETVSCEYRELDEPVRIPGCVPIPGGELPDPVQDRKNDGYKWMFHHSKRYRLADGIMVNSFLELECGAFKALLEPESGKPVVYPVGPLVDVGSRSSRADGSECLRWLDDQPRGSVVYACFGSLGTLSYEQITELGFGLEMSGQRFLWVVRRPSDDMAGDNNDDPFGFLPVGFLDRTKERGLVVDSWAPQAHVLSHGSTGGFLTHCGWNSVLESVVNGIPLIAWPLYAEQKTNAFMLVEDVKVALRPEASSRPNGIIGREEISNVVRDLMEGEKGKIICSKMKNLKDAAARVVSEDGSSTKALTQVVANWRQHVN